MKITVCIGSSCHIKGSRQVVERLQELIAEKGLKDQVELATLVEEINHEKEKETMEKTMEIKGMMCGHCEATVKKALESIPQVTEAIVSHENGTAVVKLSEDISSDVLKETVEAKDYEVTSVK